LIESGPDFVSESPSQAKMTCEAEHFKTCNYKAVSTHSGPDVGASIPSAESDKGTDNEAAIISLSIVAVVCVLSIGFLAYRMHLLKKYLHRLEEEGRSPPPMSTGDYVTSAFMPLEKIVSKKESAGASKVQETSESSQPV
jgi:hypothetical protein